MGTEGLLSDGSESDAELPGYVACANEYTPERLSEREMIMARNDPMFSRLCEARYALKDVIKKVSEVGWDKKSARAFMSICNSVEGR